MDNILQTLLNPESMEFNDGWSHIFFNATAVRALVPQVDPAAGGKLLAAGVSWNGSGWTTGRASKTVYNATGVAMVEEQLSEYLGAFLFALSVLFNIDIPKLTLGAQAASAALKFAAEVNTKAEETKPEKKEKATENQEEEEEDQVLSWELQREELPGDLGVVLNKHLKGTLVLEPKSLLEQLPLWQGVKDKAENNNHRTDGSRPQDRLLKQLQQKVLGLLRVYPCLHACLQQEEELALGQQFFGLLLALEHSVITERKKASIPGSLQETNVLFSPEDIRNDKRRSDVNRASGVLNPPNPMFHFRIDPGPKWGRWKPMANKGAYGKGFWRGRGGQTPYRGFGGGRGAYTKPSGKCSRESIEKGVKFERAQSQIDPKGTHSGPFIQIGTHSGPISNRNHQESEGTYPNPFVKFSAKQGKGVGGPPPLQKVGFLHRVVEKICSPKSVGHFDKRNCPGISPPGKVVNQESISHPKRFRISKRNFERLREEWGGKEGFGRGTHKTLSSLLCAFKGGGGHNKAPTNFGLSGVKFLFGNKKVPSRSPPNNLPLPKEGGLGGQIRPKGRLLPSPTKRGFQTLLKDASRRGFVGVSRGVFWAKSNAPIVYVGYEGVGEEVEGGRYHVLHIPRRHTPPRTNKSLGRKTPSNHGGGLVRRGLQAKFEKVHPRTNPNCGTPWVHPQFQGRITSNFKSKTQIGEKRTWQISDERQTFLSKDGRNFGPSKKFFGSPPLFKGFHRHPLYLCKQSKRKRLGLQTICTHPIEGSIKRGQGSPSKVGGETFCKQAQSRDPLGLFNSSLGGARSQKWEVCQGLLEGGGNTPHQCKGASSGHKVGKKLGKAKYHGSFVGRQSSYLLLPYKGWGEEGQFQSNLKTLYRVVHPKQGGFASKVGALKRNVGGQIVPVGVRHWGLHPKSLPFQLPKGSISSLDQFANRHVCLPGEQKIKGLCLPVASLGSKEGRCPKLQFGRVGGTLCKPPLVGNFKLASPTKAKPKPPMFDGLPLLGFRHMVAPINKAKSSQYPLFFGGSNLGDVHKLSRELNASAKVAPNLPFVLGQILESKEVEGEIVQIFLENNPSLKRYDSSFRLLWAILAKKGLDPPRATLEQVASGLIEIHSFSPSQARNAYSAMLLLPNFYHLRFHHMLKPYKTLWNTNVEKYGAFWDCEPILFELAKIDSLGANWPDEMPLADLRERLVIVCRLLCLYRSIDLARLSRNISILNSKCPFVKIRRKGWKIEKWEKVISIPSLPHISPWHLMLAYVKRTSKQGRPGGPLLLTLEKPTRPLSAGSVASITKRGLSKFGIDCKVWGAHSTRGAGVAFYKKLGLSAEQVCEIGKWKDVNTFASHYQRLDSHFSAAEKITKLVHNTSLWGSAEPEVSRTPRRPPAVERGGSDTDGEAQSHSEPTRTALGKRKRGTQGRETPPLSEENSSSSDLGTGERRQRQRRHPQDGKKHAKRRFKAFGGH